MVTIASPLDVLATADKTCAAVAMSVMAPSSLPRATVLHAFAAYLTAKVDTLLEPPASCVAAAGKMIAVYGLPMEDERERGFFQRAQQVHDSVSELRETLAKEQFSVESARLLLPRLRGKEGAYFSRLAVCTERTVLDIESTVRFAQVHGRQVLRAVLAAKPDIIGAEYNTLDNMVFAIDQPWPRSLRAARRLLAPAYSR